MGPVELRIRYEIEHRFPLRLRSSGAPIRDLVEFVEAEQVPVPGRALDLGCGDGWNAIYLARCGWAVTGVELIGRAARAARRNAASEKVGIRVVHGDASRLSDYALGSDYDLIVDSFCYHAIHPIRRDAYAAEVTKAAAPGAVLLMLAFSEPADGMHVTAEDVRARFADWEIVSSAPVAHAELLDYAKGPKVALDYLRKVKTQRYRLIKNGVARA